MKINRVSIIGMGALGGMYGELLSDKLGKDNVEFIANSSRIKKYEQEGLYVNGRPCDFKLVDEKEKGQTADLLIFAVKQTGLEAAIKSAANKVGDQTIIISLLNGISSEEIIGEVFGQDKMLYTIAEGMDAVKLGNQLTYSRMGYLWLGSNAKDQAMTNKLAALVELFDRVEMPYRLEDNVINRLWSKFMLNVGINQVVTIYEGTYGTILEEGPARQMMIAAMREVMALANKENVTITEEDFQHYLDLLEPLDPDKMPSMRQDGLQKKPTEVELFAGTVIRLGKKHGLATPVNQEIYDKVKEMEADF